MMKWEMISGLVSLATPMSVASGNVSRPYSQTIGVGSLTGSPFLDLVITDAVSPALNHGDADIHLLATAALQSSVQAQQLENLQLQQRHFGNSIIAHETKRWPIPRRQQKTHAIQSLPAQTQNPSYHQRPQLTAFSSSYVPSIYVKASPSMLVNPDEINARNTGTGTQQILERQQMSRVPNLVLPKAQLHSVIQNPDLQSSLVNQPSQSVKGLPAQNPVNSRPLPNLQRGSGSCSLQPRMGDQSLQKLYQDLWTQQMMSHTLQVLPPGHLDSPHYLFTVQHKVLFNTVAGSLVNHE